MNYVKVVRDVACIGGTIPEGTVLAVEDADGCWKILDGPYKGQHLFGYDCRAVTTEQAAYGNDCPNGNCDV